MSQVPEKSKIYVLDLEKSAKAIVHTFFCLKSLDIFLLSEDFSIVDARKSLPPFRILIPKKEFRYVVEGVNLSENDLKIVKDTLSKH
jgi:uncharacterized membrane protein (UPF0127 family)